MWQHAEFELAGRRLHHVRTLSAAAPMAMMHGVLRGWNTFLPLAPLATRYELWFLDQRGHGASDRAAPDYGVVDYVRDAVAWVRDCIGRPVVLYGHSLGGMVAAAVAAELPELVRGAILEDPPFETFGRRFHGSPFQDYFQALAPLAGSSEPLESLVDRLAGVPMKEPNSGRVYRLGDVRDVAALRFFAASLRLVDARVLDSLLAGRWLEGYDLLQVFKSIRCPVLLVQAGATQGGMLADEDLQLAQDNIQKCLPVRIPDTGHMVHWQQTQRMLNLTYCFVESLDAV